VLTKLQVEFFTKKKKFSGKIIMKFIFFVSYFFWNKIQNIKKNKKIRGMELPNKNSL